MILAHVRPRLLFSRDASEGESRFAWRKWAERRRDRQRRLNGRQPAADTRVEAVIAPAAE